MCKSCQSCLESLYWTCCEERFCYDESIAKYVDDDWENGKCYTNHTNSNENLEPITRQPTNNNNNHFTLDSHRAVLAELPIIAPDIYRVFSKSMIFKDDTEAKKYNENEENIKIDDVKPKNYNGQIGKVVSFEDESDKKKIEDEEKEEPKMSDFERMFQDELYGEHKMFKIEEEDEEDSASSKTSNSPDDGGLVMKSPTNVEKETPTLQLSSSLDEKTFEISPAKILPKPRSILLPRADSARSFTANMPKHDFGIRRVDSLSSFDNKNLKNVLARLPPKSASYLSILDYANDQEAKKSKSSDIFSISRELERGVGWYPQISKLPDTPVITGGKLPKFFAETPVIGEYHPDTSLQSIVHTPDVIFPDSDFSMPRYYRRAKIIAAASTENTINTSKSMPDLHEAGKVSKRLNKLGSRLKPLIIKKHGDESFRHSQQL